MSLERKKTEVELIRVEAAKAEMELRIAERQEEIKRVEENIKIQDSKILELKQRLESL